VIYWSGRVTMSGTSVALADNKQAGGQCRD
jgi:hypothetical protein